MFKVLTQEERNPQNRCWFCGTDVSVKYKGKIVNPCLTSNNRYIDIIFCNRCAMLHAKDFCD
jgi:hypothetical protein